ncbi:MAG: type II toxin-antitoxin system RelE/ParE family toxin [Ignavibacteria bacterium]|nr:type II toxin-antitoxin system RelE/ParE family toxin [Ignavibacteria bacterium]
MALKIVFNKRADNKLDSTLEYLKSEWSVRVANEFLEHLYETLDVLSIFPEIGTIIDDLKEIRGFLATKQIKVYYRIKDNKLIVLNFIDTRQKPK